MSERRTIVYAGGFLLPAGNASAQRALENGRLFRSLGYEVVIVGQLADGVHEAEIEGLRCINIHAPDARRPYPYYKNSAASVTAAMEAVGPERIRAVIAYNYPAWPLARLIGYARAQGFAAVAECTEWYGWEGRRVRHNLRQLAETEARIRMLARRAGNVICASDWGARFFDGLNTLVLPFVIDRTAPKWQVEPRPKTPGRRRFVYVGVPRQGLIKDYLHTAIAALADLAGKGADFDFQVAGLTEAQLLESFPGLAPGLRRLGDRIAFHGRLPHAEALSLLKSADFSLFVRPDNRMTNFGFPTKVAEAFACGVPTITTATSDIPRYVRDRETGILLAGADAASIAAGLSRALALSDEAVAAMKSRCRAEDPFAPQRFVRPVTAFLDDLR
ncbi:MAG TPA: glycosyltransferase family 4 protein [Caulobacteraceae bacterium]|nr:glycosyltransferase family 4 protein [Caulobacteraceae bacterium]